MRDAVLLMCCLLLVSAGYAVELNPPEFRQSVDRALEQIYQQEFEQAQAGFEQLVVEFPANPGGSFFLGAFWQVYMSDRGTDSLEPLFLECMDAAEAKARRVLEQEENPRAYLYQGAAHVYKAIYFGWKGDYWQVFKEGTKALPGLKRAYALDTTLTDACLGLGVSEYFHHIAGKYLTGLSLFGSVDKAIELVFRTITGQGYFARTAQYTLAWLATQEKRFVQAHALLAGLLESCPENRVFRKQLRDTYYAEKEYASAIAVGEKLAQELAQAQPDNYAGIAENALSLAKNSYRTGGHVSAREYCDQVISLEGKPGVRMKEYVKEARALKKKL